MREKREQREVSNILRRCRRNRDFWRFAPKPDFSFA